MRAVLRICGLFVALVAACAFAAPALAGTGPSEPVAVMPAAPTIDGTVAFGEWDAATSFPVTFGTLSGTAHVGRTATDFFFMLDVDDPVNAATADTALYFDNGNDGTLAPGDDILGLNQGAPPLDFFFETVSPTQLTSRPDTAAGGTDDIAAVSGVSAGHHIVEYRHPLCSGDTGHDFCFLPPAWGQPPNAIGFTIVYAPTGATNGGFGYPGGLFTVGDWGSYTIAFEPDTTPPPAPQLDVTNTTEAYFDSTASKLWYRANTVGEFTLEATNTDPESGIDHTTFPQATDLGTGWDTGPFTATSLEYFFPSSDTDPAPTGPFDVTFVNGALVEGPATRFTFDTDGNAPTDGLGCNPAACSDTNGPVTVTVSATDNGGSGIRELRYTTDGSDPGPSNGTAIAPGGSFTVSYPNTTVKLWAVDNVGNATPIVTQSVSGSFATLPNGNILYQSTRPSAADDTVSTLWEVNPASSAETQLVSTIASLHVDVAHDGSKIAWTGTNVDGQSFIVVGDRDGKNAQAITSGPADDWAAISPDGTKIAYAHLEADNTHDIYVAGIDGSNPQNITNSGGLDEIEPSWSPDGTAIAYAKWRQIGEFFDYDVMTQTPVAAGGTVTDLTINSSVDDRDPSWSPKGTLIAFSSKGAHTWPQIWTMSPDGQNPQVLTDSYPGFNDTGDQNSDPSFSPDGTKIAFVFSPGGTQNFDVFTMSADGTARTRLFTNATHEGFPAWAPLAASTALTVNTTSDHAPDGCSTDDCTLREAIAAANAQEGPDTIEFNIPGSGVQTITPTSPLPAITDEVTIDGYTQPGASANTLEIGDNATLMIVLHGSAATASAPGLDIQASGSTVRGLVVNGGFLYGIQASGTGASSNTIAGNFIGTDATGTSSQTPGLYGVILRAGASDNRIGGTTPADRNLISGVVGNQGSNGSGIGIGAGAGGAAPLDNVVQGNYIGTNPGGTSAVPNATGIAFPSSAAHNRITGNVIAGNSGDGVYMQQAGGLTPTTANMILDNSIGVAADGTRLGNAGYGIDVQPGVTDTQITNNEIAFNGAAGVGIFSSEQASIANSILGNSIHDNSGLGIDLAPTGVTANDAGDTDTGANDLQNFPIVTSGEPGTNHVAGTLTSKPGDYTIEVFQNTACDRSGNGEGANLLGSTSVTVDESGSGTWELFLETTSIPNGSYLTATATSYETFDTSEFSPCLVPAVSSVVFTVDQSTTTAGASSFSLDALPPELFQLLAGATNAAPIPSAPIPSAAVGAAPIPSAPIPSAPIPSAPIPSAPIPDAPIPSAPIPSAPIPSAGLGGLPIPSASVSNPLDAILLSSLPGIDPVALFAGTSLAGRLPQQYTLGDIYRAPLALQRFNALKVTQLPLSQTFLRGVRTLSYLLGGKTLDQITPPGTPTPTWCNALTANGGSCANVDVTKTTVIGLDIMQQLGTLNLGTRTVGNLTNGLNGTLVGEALLARIALLRTTLAAIPLSSIPSVGTVVDCARINCATRTLGDAAKLVPTAIRDTVPLKALGAAANGVTLNELVVALIPRNAFPWEQESYLGWQGFGGQAQQLQYHLDFDAQCPVAGLTIRIRLPFGFLYLPNSATLQNGTAPAVPVGDPTSVDSETDEAVWSNLSTTPACSAPALQHLRFNFKGLPGYRLGPSPSRASISTSSGDSTVTGAPVLVQRNWAAATNRATAPTIGKDTIILSHVDRADGTNYFRLPEVGRGKLVTIYMRPPDDADLDLYVVRPSPSSLLASPIPSAPIPSAPIPSAPIPSAPIPSASTSVTTTTDNPPPELLEDGPLPGGEVAVNSITRSKGADGLEAVTFRQAGNTGFDEIAVAGYNGDFSNDPFSLRVQVDDPAPLPPTCPVRTFANKLTQAGRLPVGQLPSDTKALALVNVGRMNAMYGTTATNTMLTKLNAVMSTQSVKGQVLQIDGDNGVFAASKAWDQSPCSIDTVSTYVKAINTLVAKYRGNLTNLRSITIVGNDEQIPFARVLDFTPTSSEFDNTGALAFLTQNLTVDNATYAAAGLGYVLTDDAYGAFHTRTVLGHEFFLPEVALGRLVETPAEIQAQLQRFLDSQSKTLDPTTGFVTGYDFMADGAGAVDDSLVSRIGPATDPAKNTVLTSGWDKSALLGFLDGTTPARGLNAWNAHYDFYRLMPAVFDAGLLSTANLPQPPLVTPLFNGDIFFTMGCHAGEGIPDTFSVPIPDAAKKRDWPQAYAQHGAAVFVGNTGFGYGDTASVALSERLMTQFATHLAFNGSVGEKFMITKNEYFASMGAFGPFDTKSLSEATFYGLPFWALNSPDEPTVTPPTLDPPGAGTLRTASLTITPSLTPVSDARGIFWKGGSGVVFVPGRSVQPLEKVDVTQAPTAGLVAHGFYPDALATHDELNKNLYFAKPIVDLAAHEPEPQISNDTFPANIVKLAQTDYLGQRHSTIDLIAGQSRPATPPSPILQNERLVDSIGGKVIYAPVSVTDYTPPQFIQTGAVVSGGTATIFATVKEESAGGVTRVRAFFTSGGPWTFVDLSPVPGVPNAWRTTTPVSTAQIEVGFVAQDGAGNTGWMTDKGHLVTSFAATPPAPRISIDRPLDGGTFALNQAVPASYSCSGKGGIATCVGTVANGAPVDTSTVGEHHFTVTATPLIGPPATLEVTYTVGFDFGGFLSPISSTSLNSVKAGNSVPIKFSLHGNYGLDIFAPESPSSLPIMCVGGAVDITSSTDTSGNSTLQYDPRKDIYTYSWKTERAWAGTCRELLVVLKDGAIRRAYFQFK